MEFHDDNTRAKDRILEEITKSLNTLIRINGTKRCAIGATFLSNIDSCLRHGLRDPHRGYWALIKEVSHSETLNAVCNIVSPLSRDCIWLKLVTAEGSLHSHLSCILALKEQLAIYYSDRAFLRDSARMHLLLSSLSSVHLSMDHDHNSSLAAPKDDGNIFSDAGLTVSVTSSLASPVDSGVALIDSDISEATTVNGEDTISLREDDTNFPEYDSQICDNSSNETPVGSESSDKAFIICNPSRAGGGCQDLLERQVLEEIVQMVNRNCSMKDHRVYVKVEEDPKEAAQTIEDKNKINDNEMLPSRSLTPVTDSKVIKESKNTKNATRLFSDDSDPIVYRRHRRRQKPSVNSENSKRVSFHGELIQEPGFSASFMPKHPVVKKDVVKGRYSWCAEGDAPFMEGKNGFDGCTKSDAFLTAAPATISNECKAQTLPDTMKVSEERGTPEGREDPPAPLSDFDGAVAAAAAAAGVGRGCFVLSASLSKFASMASSIDCNWSSDECDEDKIVPERLPASLLPKPVQLSRTKLSSRRLSALGGNSVSSKMPLLHRFMRSLAQRKSRLHTTHKSQLVRPPVIPIPKLSQTSEALAKAEEFHSAQMSVELAQLPFLYVDESGFTLDKEVATKVLRNKVFMRQTESLYKVFKVSSSYFLSDSIPHPLLILMSEYTLYITGMKSNLTYCNLLSVNYCDITGVIAGPRLQTLVLVCRSHHPAQHIQFPLATPENNIAHSFLSHLDVACRKSGAPPPIVRELTLNEMTSFTKKLKLSDSSEEEEEDHLFHYALVRVQDEQLSPPTTPLGPSRVGHLMYRVSESGPWMPSYFILKAGVLYQFVDQTHRLPSLVLPLSNGYCLGAHRLSPHLSRPHTFELQLNCGIAEGGSIIRKLQLAAADEYEASDWLQALVQSASGLYEIERSETTACTLLLTSTTVLTCKERWFDKSVATEMEILARAPLCDLTSLTIVTEDDAWCILEFSCREVHASSGDWVIYFASHNEMNCFKESLQRIWPLISKKPLPIRHTIEEGLHRRCAETSLQLSSSWDELLPCQQILL